MEWRLRLPMRDRREPLTPSTIPSLCAGIEDEEDAIIATDALWHCMELGRRTGTIATSGIAERYYASLDQESRKRLLNRFRRNRGLPSMEEIEAQERAEAAAERARRVAAHGRGELRLAIAPGGAIIDLAEREADAVREHAKTEALQRRREAEIAARAGEAASRRANEQARTEEMRGRVPPGFPSP